MTNTDRNWGGKREGSGRKVGSTIDPSLKKDHRIILMCTKAQYEQINEMAKNNNKKVGALILEKVLNQD